MSDQHNDSSGANINNPSRAAINEQSSLVNPQVLKICKKIDTFSVKMYQSISPFKKDIKY
jgi:hypothetical protein